MLRIFVEADCELNTKFLKVEGLFNKRKYFGQKSWKEFSEKEKNASIVLISDNSIINKIYRFPRLKKNELHLAIEQKLRKDLEFIAPLETLNWIYTYSHVNNSIIVLVSLIEKDKTYRFADAKAVTLTPLIVFNALNNKFKKTFMLAHSFKDNLITFVFLNGLLDYIKSFPSGADPIEAIELTKEFYKEHKKIDISEIYISGDWNKTQNSFIKINELVKNTNFSFFTCDIAATTKVPFLFEKESITKKLPLLLLPAIVLCGDLILYNKLEELNHQIRMIEPKISNLRSRISRLQRKKANLENRLENLNSFLNRNDIKNLLSAKRYCIEEFFDGLRPILEKTNSFILSFQKDKSGFFNIRFATFCKNINHPIEYRIFSREFQKIKVAESVSLIDSRNLRKTNAIISSWKVKIKRSSYVKL